MFPNPSVPTILVFTGCAPVDFFVCWASAEFVKQKMVTRTLPKISRKVNKVKSTDVLLEYVRTNGAGKLLLPVADSEPPPPPLPWQGAPSSWLILRKTPSHRHTITGCTINSKHEWGACGKPFQGNGQAGKVLATWGRLGKDYLSSQQWCRDGKYLPLATQ